MHFTKFQKLRLLQTGGQNLFLADLLGRSFTQKEPKLKELKHKQIPQQTHFATLTHDNQIKPVNYLIKHKTVLPPQKDHCYLILADFRNEQISILIRDKGENIITKPLDSISFEAIKPFQIQYKNPIKKYTETLIQQSAMLNDTDITDNDNSIEKGYHRMMIVFL